MGPAPRGSFWEITAIPDIRAQAAELARQVLEWVDAQQQWPGNLASYVGCKALKRMARPVGKWLGGFWLGGLHKRIRPPGGLPWAKMEIRALWSS